MALLCVGKLEVCQLCTTTLASDWRAYSRCASLGASFLFLNDLGKTSNFNARPLAEFVDLLPAEAFCGGH